MFQAGTDAPGAFQGQVEDGRLLLSLGGHGAHGLEVAISLGRALPEDAYQQVAGLVYPAGVVVGYGAQSSQVGQALQLAADPVGG